jgi:hypothetical protein
MAPRALAATLPKITKAVLAKHGRIYAAIVGEWPSMVGPALAAASLPERLGPGGVLVVRVAGGAAMEFQHAEPQIVERINAYLGPQAIVRLRLIQAPVPGRTPRPAPPPTRRDLLVESAVESILKTVTDPTLKAALGRFGRRLGTTKRAEK